MNHPRPATALIRAAPLAHAHPPSHPPSPRHRLEPAAWAALPAALRAQPGLELLALWAEPGLVHAAFREGADWLLATVPAPAGHYPALSPARPAAAWFERAIADLWGLRATAGLPEDPPGDSPDDRPWLDHGRWPLAAPLAALPRPHPGGQPPQPRFLPAGGDGVHQVPLGPLLPGGAAPAHLRCHVLGGTVRRLEVLLGYGHKGVLGPLRGLPPRAAARFVARLSAESTVAHAWAFALAAEAATGTVVPVRAGLLRAVMAELERIAAHLADWGATCAAAGFAWAGHRCGALREGLARANDHAFGHRLLMDRVVPGGIAIDIAPSGAAAILAALARVEQDLPVLQATHDDHASLQDRLAGVGTVTPRAVAAFAPGGIAGRAAGRDFDARRDRPYGPYAALALNVPLPPGSNFGPTGDAEARLRLRLLEVAESLGLIRAALARLEPGETLVPLPATAGEGLGVTEAPRGEALHWLALDQAGLVQASFIRDPGWLQWPLLEAAMAGRPLADLPLCLASLNPSAAGTDL